MQVWVTANDPFVCPICSGLEGQIFPKGIGPVPPLHDGCRCKRIDLDDEDQLQQVNNRKRKPTGRDQENNGPLTPDQLRRLIARRKAKQRPDPEAPDDPWTSAMDLMRAGEDPGQLIRDFALIKKPIRRP